MRIYKQHGLVPSWSPDNRRFGHAATAFLPDDEKDQMGEVAQMSQENAADPKNTSAESRKAIVSSAMGSALEWVDFTAYGAVSATVFPKLFFPTLDPATAILASFATFGVGFFARPAGGVIFGLLGDRIGRKKVLLSTFMLMGISSLLIGLMPTYATIGFWAPLLIVLLRFFQGFALGGEATGAQLFTMEHAPAHRRGLFGSFINVAAPVSLVLANGMLFGIATIMTEGQFEAIGWRIPFLLSILLVAVGVYLRYHVGETPAFMALEEARKADPRRHASSTPDRSMRPHVRTIVRLLMFWAAPASCFWIVNIYSITYLADHTTLSRATIFGCVMAANVIAIGATLLGGLSTDRFGRKPPLIVASIAMLVISSCYFPMLDSGNILVIVIAMALFGGSIQAQSGILPAYFAEQFPTSVRYTGSALAYTGANLIFAGPTPFIAAWIAGRSNGSSIGLTALCFGLVVMSLVALLLGPETRHVDLQKITPGNAE
jgi:MFS family permease